MKILIGNSKAIQKVRDRVEAIVPTRKHVVIVGEPGTGKSVVARMIHEMGANSDKPFAVLNIDQIDELKLQSITRSILTRREFINPTTSEHGNFVLPDGSAVILDEIDQAGLAAKKIIADFIEGMLSKSIPLRILLLLDTPIKELVRSGGLPVRLQKLTKDWETLSLPALRERAEDIPDLVEHFVLSTAKEMGLGDVVIDVNALTVLVRKEWKGNVQELKTFVERVMLLSEDKDTFALPESLMDEQSELTQMLHRIEEGVDFAIDKSMELIEKRILERVLRKFQFNQSKAARFLKITEDTLRYRMKKLGIHNIHQG